MKGFIAGAVSVVAVYAAVRLFGWLPVVVVVGCLAAGAAAMGVLIAIEFNHSVGRWFGW